MEGWIYQIDVCFFFSKKYINIEPIFVITSCNIYCKLTINEKDMARLKKTKFCGFKIMMSHGRHPYKGQDIATSGFYLFIFVEAFFFNNNIGLKFIEITWSIINF